MSISHDLWQANAEIARECLDHPFVQGIAEGTLLRNCFAFYVGQDAFFLEAFARAYSIAAAKAPDWKSFEAFHTLADGVRVELRLHQGYAAAWQVNLQAVQPEAATRRYTDFLLATAWSQEMSLTAVAMSPCLRLYAFLGQQLAQKSNLTHQYTEWIRTYSAQEFQQLAETLEQLVDHYAHITAVVHSTYRYAMLCERDFFQAAWEAVS